MGTNGNGLKSRLDHLENRLETHLSSAGQRFDEYSRFQGATTERINSIADNLEDIHKEVLAQGIKIDNFNRRLAYFAGGLGVLIFLLNLLSPYLSRLFNIN